LLQGHPLDLQENADKKSLDIGNRKRKTELLKCKEEIEKNVSLKKYITSQTIIMTSYFFAN
jgi:hypothetical protein